MKDAIDRLVERLDGLVPSAALVLGSGLGGLVDEVKDAIRIPYAELPGFPQSGVTGHAGAVVAGHFAGKPVLMLAGRAHYYDCLLYTSPSPRDGLLSRMPSSA